MRKTGMLLVASLCACAAGSPFPRTAAGAPVLTIGGAVRGGPFALGAADLEKLPRRSVRGVDPASGRAAVWEGASLEKIVGRLEIRKGADVLLVRTAGREAIAISLTIVRQFKPVLADRADGVPTSPRVLAWPTLEQRGIETDPRASLWWARGVVALDVVDWQKTFGAALATPDGAADGARRGSASYGMRCIACHRLRGVGGDRGPELTTVAARMRQGSFAALLEKHPGWEGAGGDPPGEEGAAEIWSFLHAVAVTGTSAQPGAPGGAERGERPSSAR